MGRGVLAFGAHHVIGYVPAGQHGGVRLNSGPVVGKQGERGKATVSVGHTRLRTR